MSVDVVVVDVILPCVNLGDTVLATAGVAMKKISGKSLSMSVFLLTVDMESGS